MQVKIKVLNIQWEILKANDFLIAEIGVFVIINF